MPTRSIHLLLAACLLSLAAPASAQEKPAPKSAPQAKAGKPAAAPRGKLKPVDLNSATKNELSFMLKIPEDVAARIVAGRPYPTKARLLTQNIVSAEVYASIKDRVVARQPGAPAQR